HRRITPFQTDPPYSISIRHRPINNGAPDTAISTHMQTPTYRYSDEHTLPNPHATVYPIPEKKHNYKGPTRHTQPSDSYQRKHPPLSHIKFHTKEKNLCQKKKMTYSRTSTNKTKNASIIKSTNSVSKIPIMNFIQKASTPCGTPTKNTNRPKAPWVPTSITTSAIASWTCSAKRLLNSTKPIE